MAEPFKIIVAGEGGQGVLSIAKTIAYAAWLGGKQAAYIPYFSTEKRGGLSVAYAMIGDEPIPFPKFAKADLWVAMSQRSIGRIADALQDGTTVIVNSSLARDLSAIEKWNPYRVDATGIAKHQLRKPRTFNMIVMGAMLRFVPGLSKEKFSKALDKTFGEKYVKDPALRDLNQKALDIGYGLVMNAAPRLDAGSAPKPALTS